MLEITQVNFGGFLYQGHTGVTFLMTALPNNHSPEHLFVIHQGLPEHQQNKSMQKYVSINIF